MTDPLFLEDLDAMKSALRLSGVPAVDEDANSILQQAILAVRTNFYRRLGGTRVGQLVAIDFEDNPETDDEMLRALAQTTEVKYTFVELMDRLPMLWMDDSGGAWQQFNEQGTFRKLGMSDRKEMRTRMLADIEQAMQFLAGEQVFGEESSISVGTYGSQLCPPPRIGDTIFRRWCRTDGSWNIE